MGIDRRGGGWCYFIMCTVERRALFYRKLPWSLLHMEEILSDDLNVVSVCPPWWSSSVNTAPSHCVTLKSPSSMLPDDIPCMSCSTPHNNTVRETVGYGTGDRCHSSAGLIFHLLW